MLPPCPATNTDVGSVSPFPLHRRTHCAHFPQSLYFPLLESVPYLSAKRVFRRSAASRYRRRSPSVFRISGGTGLGILVCSSTATNVTYAVVVCFRSPVIAFSE
jgi:hypothetical protein